MNKVKVHKQGKKLSVVMAPEQLAQICFRLSESIDLRDRILAHQIIESMKELGRGEENEENNDVVEGTSEN